MSAHSPQSPTAERGAVRAMGMSDADWIAALEAENVLLRNRLRQYEASTVELAPPETVSPSPEQPAIGGGSLTDRGRAASVAASRTFVNTWEEGEDVPTYPARPSFHSAPNHPSTEIVCFDGCPNDPYHPSSMPLYQTATFVQPNINEFGQYDYTRSGNPTRTAVETLAARLEGAHASFAFTSGMAALSTLIGLLSHGDEVLAGDDLYGGMHRLLTQVASRNGVTVRFVNTGDLAALKAEVSPGVTKLIHIESPTNPRMRVSDLKGIAKIAHAAGALVSVDGTMMTPVRCQPLLLGCDVVIHSATKFFSGHSDVMGGFLSVRDADLAKRAAFNQNAIGTALAPFDCWLMLRGLKTLALRVEKQEVNCLAVAQFLCRQAPETITVVHYAGLDPSKPDITGRVSITHEAYELHRQQCTGPGTVLSFETGNAEWSKRFVNACRLFKLTVSFGSCNSLVEMPCALSHASIPKEKRTLPEDLVRLSVGIEQVHDLIRDLAQAMVTASATADS